MASLNPLTMPRRGPGVPDPSGSKRDASAEGVSRVQIIDDFKSGGTDSRPWMRIPVLILEGPHRNRHAYLTLRMNTKDRKFRRTVEIICGISLAPGRSVALDEVRAAARSHIFTARVEERGGRLRVDALIERLGS